MSDERIKLDAEGFIEAIRESHIDRIEDLIHGEGWKMQKGAKKGEPPILVQGVNPHDVNNLNKHKESPLYWACKKGRTDVVNLLLKNGADHSKVDEYGYSPIYWAAMGGHREMVKSLLDAGANPNAPSIFNHTPLSRAEEKGYVDVIKLLRRAGAITQSGRAEEEDPDGSNKAALEESWQVLIENKQWLSIHPLAKDGTLTQDEIYGDFEFPDPNEENPPV